MLNFLRKPPSGTTLTLHLSGMHCASCSLTVDDTLEELDGVLRSHTSYAKSTTRVTYDPQRITPASLLSAVESLGYTVQTTT